MQDSQSICSTKPLYRLWTYLRLEPQCLISMGHQKHSMPHGWFITQPNVVYHGTYASHIMCSMWPGFPKGHQNLWKATESSCPSHGVEKLCPLLSHVLCRNSCSLKQVLLCCLHLPLNSYYVWLIFPVTFSPLKRGEFNKFCSVRQ